jgi:hypothetical protein
MSFHILRCGDEAEYLHIGIRISFRRTSAVVHMSHTLKCEEAEYLHTLASVYTRPSEQ